VDRALHRGHDELKLGERSWLWLDFHLRIPWRQRSYAPEKPRDNK
jgi:hypothetical protein